MWAAQRGVPVANYPEYLGVAKPTDRPWKCSLTPVLATHPFGLMHKSLKPSNFNLRGFFTFLVTGKIAVDMISVIDLVILTLRKEKTEMPHYMTQFAYTSDAWAALAKNPQNREEVLRALVEKLGGRLLTFYYAFGEYDGVFITEMPDETTVTAAVLAAISPGHVKAIKTTVLLTTEQTLEAMRKAGTQSYQAPR
jgi:uncharacterized protein with GYD domain